MCEATCMCRLAPTVAAFLSKSTGICVECRSRTKRFDGRLVCHCNIKICVESVVVHNPARWRAYACSQMSFERRDASWPGLWKAHGSCCTRFRSPCSSCGGHKFRHETRITSRAATPAAARDGRQPACYERRSWKHSVARRAHATEGEDIHRYVTRPMKPSSW